MRRGRHAAGASARRWSMKSGSGRPSAGRNRSFSPRARPLSFGPGGELMRAFVLSLAGPVLVLVAVAVPVTIGARQQAAVRNFRVVKEGSLYRSGQLRPAALRRVLETRAIRTVVNLREGMDGPDRAEEDYCVSHGVRFVRIRPLSWDGTV